MRMPSRRTAVWLAGALAALVLLGVLTLVIEGDDGVDSAGPLPDRPVVVGRVSIVPRQYEPGDLVAARITLRADRPMQLRNVVVEVRDKAGNRVDAAERPLDIGDGTTSMKIGEKPITTEVTRQISVAGVYTFNLAYQWKGRTYALPPYEQFTVK